MKLRLAAAICCVIAAAAAEANLYRAARARYYEAIDGRDAAWQEARALFVKLREVSDDDPKVLAYAGSIELKEASRAFAPWKKGKLAKAGLELLDEAVKRAPDDLEVRFVRAASTFPLPKMFGRNQQSEADFAWLAARLSASPASATIEPRLAAAALYRHGLIRERLGDRDGARAAWGAAVRLGSHTGAGADARKRLHGQM